MNQDGTDLSDKHKELLKQIRKRSSILNMYAWGVQKLKVEKRLKKVEKELKTLGQKVITLDKDIKFKERTKDEITEDIAKYERISKIASGQKSFIEEKDKEKAQREYDEFILHPDKQNLEKIKKTLDKRYKKVLAEIAQKQEEKKECEGRQAVLNEELEEQKKVLENVKGKQDLILARKN